MENKQAKLLVVDDEQEITEFLHDYFEEKGFEPFVANTGEKALELLKEQNPNIVLLDVRLTGSVESDGIRILEQIKKYNKTIKVIMVTGVSDETIINKALSLGASDYITKPLSLDYLDATVMEKIREVLARGTGSENKPK